MIKNIFTLFLACLIFVFFCYNASGDGHGGGYGYGSSGFSGVVDPGVIQVFSKSQLDETSDYENDTVLFSALMTESG
ncbi:MAG: hypothetical protein GY795_20485 [Desulfobacterales bacterium]|nr:hypothetical protein [Desulfobacterales bacterium]